MQEVPWGVGSESSTPYPLSHRHDTEWPTLGMPLVQLCPSSLSSSSRQHPVERHLGPDLTLEVWASSAWALFQAYVMVTVARAGHPMQPFCPSHGNQLIRASFEFRGGASNEARGS